MWKNALSDPPGFGSNEVSPSISRDIDRTLGVHRAALAGGEGTGGW
jgi:hypothetical protein